MGNPPTTGLTAETRELLTLIRDALDLPYAATPDGHERRKLLRNDNATRVVATLERVLEDETDLAIEVRVLRTILATDPVDYVTKDGEAGR
ncbi:hypothetical protein [Actinomadura sp. WAC 06369]|uniref:hypothetical protein n=1 Tax=Actinomadura sp. WAC 06369 TaxID=2203193 RepID=UPI000F795770|nr:hypothetical protein [Actinomadura sp. WAC 06369]RSN71360.1 hypothetical protein DMH08_02865 [Actinomadura sp. WAC 06369]